MITVHRYVPGYPYLDDDEFVEAQVSKVEEIFELDFIRSFSANPDFELFMKGPSGHLLMAKMSFRREPLIVAVLQSTDLLNYRMPAYSYTRR